MLLLYRCVSDLAVPLGHVHSTPPVITPARDPATELVSIRTYDNVTKPFEVVQAPADLLTNKDSMYMLAFEDKSDTDILDVQVTSNRVNSST